MTGRPSSHVAGQLVGLSLLMLFVGAVLQWSKLGLLDAASRQYMLKSYAPSVSFLLPFAATKACFNFLAGAVSDRCGRRMAIILGWCLALLLAVSLWLLPSEGEQSWSWALLLLPGALLGGSQGLCWSGALFLNLDWLGPQRHGLASGLNETVGYTSIALSALAYSAIVSLTVDCRCSAAALAPAAAPMPNDAPGTRVDSGTSDCTANSWGASGGAEWCDFTRGLSWWVAAVGACGLLVSVFWLKSPAPPAPPACKRPRSCSDAGVAAVPLAAVDSHSRPGGGPVASSRPCTPPGSADAAAPAAAAVQGTLSFQHARTVEWHASVAASIASPQEAAGQATEADAEEESVPLVDACGALVTGHADQLLALEMEALDWSETSVPAPRAPASARKQVWRMLWRDRRQLALCVAGFVANMITSLAWGLLLIWVRDRLHYSSRQRNLVTSAYSLPKGLLQVVSGRLSDTIGRRQQIIAGLGASSIILATLAGVSAFPNSVEKSLGKEGLFGVIVTCTALLGVSIALMYPVLIAAVSDCAQPARKATAVGVYRACRDSGYAAGVVIGVLADASSPAAAIGCVSAVCLLTSIFIAVVFVEPRRPTFRAVQARVLL